MQLLEQAPSAILLAQMPIDQACMGEWADIPRLSMLAKRFESGASYVSASRRATS
jgi:hypothetical protein